MDTYSDLNSCPPDVPEGSVGSSVSSRLQDEYEELLKYAVVVPKLDVDDIPRVLTDSKKSFGLHKQTSFSEVIHDDSSETDEEMQEVRASPSSNKDTGRVITPGRPRIAQSETPIQTVKSHPSPSQSYPAAYSAHRPPLSAQRPTFTTQDLGMSETGEDDSEDESGLMFERTVTSERPPSESDLKNVERKLNDWTRQLSSNVMEEIAKMKIQLNESSRHQLHIVQSKHSGEMNTVQNELEGMKELLHTYEVSIERKDGVIGNLTRSLQNQKEKFETLRSFTEWKINFAANKQEGYGMQLAMQHHQRSLKRQAWRRWHAIIVEKWRHRVEKACQAKAQEICIAVTNDYEAKLKSLDEKYMTARDEVMGLHKQRDNYEETMKKAFMRGVCALNMEAMNMFHEPEEADDAENQRPTTVTHSASMHQESSRPVTVSHEPTYSTASKRSTIQQGKRFQTTITANRSSVPPQRRSTGVLVERHAQPQTDERPSSASSTQLPPPVKQGPGSKVRPGQSARVVRIVK